MPAAYLGIPSVGMLPGHPDRMITRVLKTVDSKSVRAKSPLFCRSRRGGITAMAKGMNEPPDVPKEKLPGSQGGREWLQSILSRFGPVKEKASNTTVLDFEKPLVELDNRIKEVGVSIHSMCPIHGECVAITGSVPESHSALSH